MVLLQIVSVPLFFNFFIVNGGDGVTTFAAYFAVFVWTFPDGIHLFRVVSVSSDEGFS